MTVEVLYHIQSTNLRGYESNKGPVNSGWSLRCLSHNGGSIMDLVGSFPEVGFDILK